MNSIFRDFLNLKNASKFKKYSDQHCYVACLETVRDIGALLKPDTKLYKLRDYKRKCTDGTDHQKEEFGVFLF